VSVPSSELAPNAPPFRKRVAPTWDQGWGLGGGGGFEQLEKKSSTLSTLW
jgi:hypothetical protein